MRLEGFSTPRRASCVAGAVERASGRRVAWQRVRPPLVRLWLQAIGRDKSPKCACGAGQVITERKRSSGKVRHVRMLGLCLVAAFAMSATTLVVASPALAGGCNEECKVEKQHEKEQKQREKALEKAKAKEDEAASVGKILRRVSNSCSEARRTGASTARRARNRSSRPVRPRSISKNRSPCRVA